MMTRTELEKFKAVTGFNIWQVERDYLQHLVLLFMSRHTKEDLVFKGGTALQKVYALNRFSIDLDFTVFHQSSTIETIKGGLVNDLALFGYNTTSKDNAKTGAEDFALAIEGPLFNGKPASLAVVRLEISSREKIALSPSRREVTPVYTDIQPYIALVMDMDEMLAEKVRAVMTRDKPRDLFDLKFIIEKGYKPNVELINNKLAYYKMSFDPKLFMESVNSHKTLWHKEMSLLLHSEVPPFEDVAKKLCELF